MDNYQVIREIGKGSFGRVYLVKHKVERKHYCMKTIKLEGIAEGERKACQTEVKLLETMMHPNIVGFKESFVARRGKLLCIIMTYCDGGDLSERLKQNGKRLFKEDQILHWFVQLALGLHFMHDMNEKCVLHRDLKTQNIFLLGNGRLVIGDLGISKVLDETTDFTKTTIGTPYYMSPELYKSRPYNHKADVWALGCVLYEMTTLKHAFTAKSLNGLMGKVVKGRYDPISKSYSKNLSKLVDSMLALEPSRRPSLPDILSLPFIKRHVYRFLQGITERPTAQIGDGTMVLRKAALGVGVTGRNKAGMDQMLEKQTVNLKKQLESLGMKDVVQQAYSPHSPSESDENRPIVNNSRKSSRSSPSRPSERKQRELREAAAEHRNALLLEKERKRAVENALAKLRKERIMRAKERQARMERQRNRESLAQKRQAAKRAEDEKKRKAALEERKLAQKRAQERIREYNQHSRGNAVLNRWKQNNPHAVAQRKAKQFEKQFKNRVVEEKSTSPARKKEKEAALQVRPMCSSPPPPPPPLSSNKERLHQEKEEKKREAEEAHKELLMKAAHERMQELRDANERQKKQFRQSEEAIQKPVDTLNEVQDDETDDNESDDNESDNSSVPDAMQSVDSDDDDIDDKEVELQIELEAATMRCSTIKKTLQHYRAQIATPVTKDVLQDDSEDDYEKSDAVAVVDDQESNSDSESDSDSSSDDGLFSPVYEDKPDRFISARCGGLKSRVRNLEDECIRALGKKRFEQVYNVLKSNLDNKLRESNQLSDKALEKEMNSLLAGDGKLAYWSKIDNLIFMQEAI
mmetsp:Transcript_14636/g.25721  ORF Transcript_14636/g.25721 Transcript_14636/m.25721 type:complete len:806 (-) Transcript_14636:19-2436(-)